jgi:ubiquinone/menaquinone biosynthesis C-methylase UbiE
MTKQASMEGFTNVDRTTDPKSFVRYLETASTPASIQTVKQRTFELLEVQPGFRLLDVGCGLGEDVQALAQRVGPTGRVVGIDNSETMVTEARARAAGRSLPVEYCVGDAQRLEFADNSFDGCRAERILVHLEDPAKALGELVRVARPGARLVVVDPDFETLVLHGGDRTVTRKLLNFLCDSIRSGWVGRQLPALFRQAQLMELAVFAEVILTTEYPFAAQVWRLQENAERAQENGVVTASEAATWLTQLAEASQGGGFLGAITFFGVSGRKP